jgi:hypothetical protein
MIRQSQVPQFEREANEVDEEIGCVDTPIDEDGAVDIWV